MFNVYRPKRVDSKFRSETRDGHYSSNRPSRRNPDRIRTNPDRPRFPGVGHLVENQGSGIRAMLEAMRRANLEPPRFDDKRSSFWVTFRNHTLMSPEAVTWLNQFATLPLNDRQRLALVYLRCNDQITNSDYQRLNQVDALAAGRELRGLVQSGLVQQESARRWTYYTLRVPRELPGSAPALSEEEQILAFARENGSIANAECQALLGVDSKRAWYILKKLTENGSLAPTGKGKGRRYRPV